MDEYFVLSLLHRSVSMTVTSDTTVTEQMKPAESDEYPPLLKHIMSSGSMVTDIEKHQIQQPPGHSVDTILPDLTQPPPTHPAYRGPSPNMPKPLPVDSVSKVPDTESNPYSVKGLLPHTVTGNLAQQSSSHLDHKLSRTTVNSLVSESKPGSRISPSGDADSRKISPHRSTDIRSDSVNKVPSPVSSKGSSLLTPGELLHSSGGGATGYSALIDKVR